MRIFILADDLTGGNGTAALLRRECLPSQTHLFPAMVADGPPRSLYDTGAHVINLETRELSPAETTRRLALAAGWISHAPGLVCLRIDSTLRGPVAASIEALVCDAPRLALVVPAFPASGRTTRDGIHYVYGVKLADTEVARDPSCPVTESHLGRWLGSRMTAPSAMLRLDDVRRGPGCVVARLETHLAAGVRAVFCDAETDGDVDCIARAAAVLRERRGVVVLPVDPGPFTAALVRVLREPSRLHPQVFGVVASLMPTSREQLEFVEDGGSAFVARYVGQDAAALVHALEQAPAGTKALLVRTDTVDLGPDARRRLPPTLAEVFDQMVARFPSLGGFVLSGGETASRLLAGLGAHSLHIQGEIQPLISLSRIVGGRLNGRYLVTKGGTVGTQSAIADALGRLYEVLAEDRSNGGDPV